MRTEVLTKRATRRSGARARLRRVLRDEVEGKRTCVLVLGDGVNREASRRRGGAVPTSDWMHTLTSIWQRAGGKRSNAPLESMAYGSLAWTSLVDQWSSHHQVAPSVAAARVCTELCARLNVLERGRRAGKLSSSLLDGRLANIISFSIDRRLVLQAGATRVRSRRSRESFLNRHHEVQGTRGMTRVWFPYGDTSRPASISIGEEMFAERGDDVEHVVNGAAGLEAVTFSSHEVLWAFVLEALGASGMDRSRWHTRY